MKKYLLFMLIVCIAFNVVGCSLPSVEAPTDTQTMNPTISEDPTTVTTAPVAETFDQKPMIAVSLPVVDQTQYAEDGTLIFRYSYRNMSLIVPDPEVADKVIVDFLNRIDQTANHAAQILEAAKVAYSDSSQWTPYLCQIDYDTMRIDPGVLSLMGSYASYSGTPHPEKNYLSVNYNLLNGNVLTLEDILTDDASTDTLCSYIIQELNRQKDERFLYEDFEDTVKEQFGSNTAWFFSQTGLCFYFSPYEIAPYASGLITVEIPYDMLGGILHDAYFPLEIECGSSKLIVTPFDQMDLDRFTQFSEVVLDTSDNKILLYTESTVSNVQIEAGSWNADGTVFTPEQTVFAAYSLTPGDATMVESAITNTLPSLRLSYDTAGGTVKSYITFNNDQPVLTEES